MFMMIFKIEFLKDILIKNIIKIILIKNIIKKRIKIILE